MNLFIIRTPFQAFLSEKIIKNEELKDVITVYISPANNKLQKEAFQRIGSLSTESYYLHLGENKNKIIKFFKHLKVYIEILKLNLKKHNILDSICVSSIDSTPIQLIISQVKFQSLYTFDDGSANYNYTGKYYTNYKSGFILSALTSMFGNKYTQKDILNISKGHYAVLPQKTNLHSNIIHVNMGLKEKSNQQNYQYESCNVHIGIPYDVISNNPKQLKKDIERKLMIDYYIPHPRLETSEFLKDKIYKDINAIAEVKIEHLLKTYEKINVYAFQSTVMFTLKGVKRVNLFLLNHNSLHPSALHDELSSRIENYNLSED